MALFKTQEEKDQQQFEKDMQALERYGLQNLSNPHDLESVKKIIQELRGTGLMETGSLLSGSEKDLLKTQMLYQRAMIEQNFIIIRQLDSFISRLK